MTATSQPAESPAAATIAPGADLATDVHILPDPTTLWSSRVLVGLAAGIGSVAVRIVLQALANTALGDPTADAAGYLTFIFGVLVASLLAGVAAGIIATVIAAVAELTIFSSTGGSGGDASGSALRLGLFIADGVIVSLLSHAMLQARVRAEMGRQELTRLYQAERAGREAAERSELLRAQAHEDEGRARAEAEASRATLAFLANASRLLAASLDYETTVQQLAELIVPTLADWCAVDIVEADGSIRALAVAHADPGKVALVREFRDRFPPEVLSRGSAEAIATGAPVLIPVLDDDAIDAMAPSPEVADYAKRLGLRSFLAVPLRTADGIIGAIAFSSGTPGRYGPGDLPLVEDLAHRAADVIQHARLFRDASQFVATVDATLDAVFIFDPDDLRFTYVNQGAVDQVGRSREELLGMQALDIKPAFDDGRYRELIAPLLDGSKASITHSTMHLHSDGSQVPVEAFLQAVRLPGDAVRVIVTARDIRRQIEVEASLFRLARAERTRAAELSAVIRGMGEGVLVCDASGGVILSNPAAAIILGASVERYDELLHQLEEPAAGLPPLRTAGGPVEVRMKNSDRWIDLSTFPVSLDPSELGEEGETTILLLRDVTAARQARAAREAFVGVMSHELRTPITTIYGTTKLMHRITDPDQTRNMLLDIEAEADRLYRLVEDLLILSRAETGIQIEGEPVLLQHVVRSVLAGESTRWPGTTFMALVPGGLPPVSGDRTYLEQVVRNLIGNAAKYGPTLSTVEVRAEVRDGEIAVVVLDEGPGFSEDESANLFELFYRAPATAKKASGAGIGLYVARALIEAMGGRIWANTRPEGGAEFGFTVPILETDSELDGVEFAGELADDDGAVRPEGRPVQVAAGRPDGEPANRL